MEKYLNSTKGILGLFQATMTEESLNRSAEAGEKMWEAIHQISNDYQLNVHEMANAAFGIHTGVVEVLMEQMDIVKKEGKTDE